MADFALIWESGASGSADLKVVDDDLLSDEGFTTAVLLSLFLDARAEADEVLPSDDGDRRGWWADEFAEVEGDRIGSKLWLIDTRAKTLANVVDRAIEAVRESLAWLIEDGHLDELDVTAEIEPPIDGKKEQLRIRVVVPGTKLEFDASADVVALGPDLAPSELWELPAFPGFFDEEFNESGIPSPWAADFTVSGSPILLTASFGSGDPRLDVNNKKSWLRVQPPGDSTRNYVYRDFGGGELPDGTYWARLVAPYRFGNPLQGDGEVALTMAADLAGSPDHANENIRIYHSEKDAGIVQPSFDRTVGGADTVIAQLSDGEGLGMHHEYVAIVKTGSDLDGYVAGRGGNWVRLGTYTHAATMIYVGFLFENFAISQPGNLIMGADFFRRGSTRTAARSPRSQGATSISRRHSVPAICESTTTINADRGCTCSHRATV
jgi:phage gp46-like protein